ncbi:MAG: thiol reductant ABC exporter subunit CydC [Treponema sp.]|jgi:ATP-binding cassette subfamily C protein CydC|nr:thiol reductant ABC exporter subunit CydC [Treponema sp.]
MKTFSRLLSLMRPYWPVMAGAAFCGALTIASNVSLLGASAVLISSAALAPPVLQLYTLIVGVRFFGISRAFWRYVERYVTHDVTFRILKKLRVWFYRKIEPLAPANLQSYSSGRLFKQIVGDIENLQFFYLRVLVAPFIALVVLIGCVVFMLFFCPAAAGLLAALFFLSGVAVPLWVRRMTRGMAARQADRWERFHTQVVDLVLGLGELQVYDAMPQKREEIRAGLRAITGGQKKLFALDNLSACLIQYFSHIAMLGGVFFSVPLVAEGRLEGVFLTMCGLIMWAAFEAVTPLPLALTKLDEGLIAAGRLFALAGEPQADAELETAGGEPAAEDGPPQTAAHTVEPSTGVTQAAVEPAEPSAALRTLYAAAPPELVFEGVNFRYGPEEQFALQDLSFRLAPGGKIALAGPNGSGKSTIINLLLKFWPYAAGSLRVDGRELRDWPEDQVRDLLGVLNQDPYIFHTSIRENILLARPEAGVEEMEEASRRARLHDFVRSLPEGYETITGENGFKLSGGQRQRLALARIYLKNSPVLVLDEVEQGLDTLTGQEVWRNLRQWARNKSVITITHHLRDLSEMDEILVMLDGRIVERGNHASLLAQGGLYTRLAG